VKKTAGGNSGGLLRANPTCPNFKMENTWREFAQAGRPYSNPPGVFPM
jgi:hypothetical protein